jgi:endonuclease YncB( thermonuclease family)
MLGFIGMAAAGLAPSMITATDAAGRSIIGTARVLDGGTLDIAGERVRLLGMDAPEGKQLCQRGGREWPCGEIAAAALAGLVAGQAVQCDVKGQDRYSRALAVCRAGSKDIGRELVRRGLAVAYYPKRGVRGPSYDAEEADAEAAQRGLWGGSFIRPSEWRQGER